MYISHLEPAQYSAGHSIEPVSTESGGSLTHHFFPHSLSYREPKGLSHSHVGNKGQLMEFKSISFKVSLSWVWEEPQKNWICGGGGRRERFQLKEQQEVPAAACLGDRREDSPHRCAWASFPRFVLSPLLGSPWSVSL